jgi:hypothetical protein
MLHSNDRALFFDVAQEWIARADLWEAHRVVAMTAGQDMRDATFAQVQAALEHRHPALGTIALRALRERKRQNIVQNAMRNVRDRDLRLLFAMLINAPDRRVICDLMGQCFPHDDPFERILDSLNRLRQMGVLRFESAYASLLLDAAIRGRSFANVVEAVRERDGVCDEEMATLGRDWYALHSSDLMQPLLRHEEQPATLA